MQTCSQSLVASELHSLISVEIKKRKCVNCSPLSRGGGGGAVANNRTITGEAIAVEGISGIAAASVASHCVEAVLSTHVRPKRTFVKICNNIHTLAIHQACSKILWSERVGEEVWSDGKSGQTKKA